jgi:Mg2+/Co2+ transporter CorB
MLITGGAILLLLILSAFFSGSETALTVASRPLMHQMAQNGDRRGNARTG